MKKKMTAISLPPEDDLNIIFFRLNRILGTVAA